MAQVTLEEIVSLAKRRGFIFQTSEIYGGLKNGYDLGPLGVELFKNIKDLWWKTFIHQRPDMVGIDSQIILHPETWVASGHVSSFSDPLVEDKKTHERFRADHLIEAWLNQQNRTDLVVEDMQIEEMAAFIKDNNIKSPAGNEVTKPQSFNLLFETSLGTVVGKKSIAYLRGETAQGIFSNFKQVIDSTRVSLPFGIGQMGKAFRNEITQGQFVFRTFEFEAAEIEYFFDPETTDWQSLFEEWKQAMWHFAVDIIGLSPEKLSWRQHTDKERSHYSKETYDLDYEFPFGKKELWGIAYRTDYDLSAHAKHSGQKLDWTDSATGKKIVPHVIEPALGLNRLMLALLTQSYQQDVEQNKITLKLPPHLAPYKAAIFPLVKNKPEIVGKAKEVFSLVSQTLPVTWDDRGNIGKRYYYQDEIGTPYCVTVDYQTLEDNTVTVRNRDTASQERINADNLISYIYQQINGDK